VSAAEGVSPTRGRRGFVLGKLLPPHLGHLHLIEQAAQRCDHLTVLVGTLEREPIPGALRVQWLRECLAERGLHQVAVVHVTDENPQLPHEHPDFWDIWVASIRRALPDGVEVVFSSEDYGDELAARLGLEHVAIDKLRLAVPISATRIRACPWREWEFIPRPVRPWFVRRVCIYGPESTGKTTLAQELAAHYATTWVPEHARTWLEAKGRPCALSDIEPIALGQVASEEAALARARGVLFCDTDVLTTTVWSERYFGTVPPLVQALAAERSYHLYLMTAPDVPWVADALRDQEAGAAWFEERLEAELVRRGRAYVRVFGSWEQRWSIALAAVDRLLGLRGVEEGG
jgi:HTH-type transcriptional regulator, transcriptional repressor of NAD biosynthesis genes